MKVPTEIFRGKRVLVTGHTGFKGSWLSLWLTGLGAEVLGYALAPESDRAHFTLLGLENRVRHVLGDIRNYEALMGTFESFEPEFVFHLAAQPLVRRSYRDPRNTFDTNVGGGANVLEAVRNTPSVRALVFVTSDKCYANKEWLWGYRENDELGGKDPYSASKAAAEIVFKSYLDSFLSYRAPLGAASVRAGNVIGGGDWSEDRIVPDCVRMLEESRAIKLRNPDATRPWQHVLDPLNGYLTLAAALYESPNAFSGSWNFGPSTDDVRTVLELAEGLVSGWGGGEIESAREENAPHESTLLQLNCEKSRSMLGWRPKWHFEKVVEETARWYRHVHAGGSAFEISTRQIAEFEEVSR